MEQKVVILHNLLHKIRCRFYSNPLVVQRYFVETSSRNVLRVSWSIMEMKSGSKRRQRKGPFGSLKEIQEEERARKSSKGFRADAQIFLASERFWNK